jgi:hypothetical protein
MVPPRLMTVSDKTAEAQKDRHGPRKFFSFAARALLKRILFPEPKARFGFFPLLRCGPRFAKRDNPALTRNIADDLKRGNPPRMIGIASSPNDFVNLA